MAAQVSDKTGQVPAGHDQFLDVGQEGFRVLVDHGLGRLRQKLVRDAAGQLEDLVPGNDIGRKLPGLVQKADGITKGPPRQEGDDLQGLIVDLEVNAGRNVPHAADDLLLGDAAELEMLASGDNGSGDPVGLCRRHDEDGVGRRLLQGLEKGVEGALGEHVDFIDDVDLVLGPDRGEDDFLGQPPDVVNAVMGGGVNLIDVHEGAVIGGQANLTGIARIPFLGIETVDGLGEDLGQGGLTRSPGP